MLRFELSNTPIEDATEGAGLVEDKEVLFSTIINIILPCFSHDFFAEIFAKFYAPKTAKVFFISE